jgi:hypothetical protein
MASRGRWNGAISSVAHSVVLRVTLYYLLLGAGVALLWRVLPPATRPAALDTLAALTGDGSPSDDLAAGTAVAGDPADPSGAVVALTAVASAFALALPVAWVYMYTRRKKGYRQSVVHSLILLPVVVAGVVAVVKSSLALAFSLAGIVAAVRFRTTLDDSKDAVYIFLATALGLAAGVQLDVAAVLSVTFNAVVLLLWHTDFGRTPPGLEDARAQRQMERALAIANRTSQFVARVDREILESMAPAQLDALAGRVRRRRAASGPDVPAGPAATRGPPKPDARLRVFATDVDAVRRLLEPALAGQAKRWSFVDARPDADGVSVVEYEIRLKKGITPADALAAVRRLCEPYVTQVELQ